MDTQIRVKFLGGTADGDNLTGSCILLTIKSGKNITRLLIDAGLIQCSPKEFFTRNRAILKELNPSLLDGIIVTHPHTDHVGGLPLVVNHGSGDAMRIICTESTARIIGVMLADSAKIQAETCYAIKASAKANVKVGAKRKISRDQQALGKREKLKNKKNGQPIVAAEEPLYTMEDVEKTCSLIKNGGFPYQEWIKLFNHGVSLKFYQSGHVLGGAICVIRVKTKTKDIYLGFSGDLGRHDGIILPPPATIEEKIDYWFTESTYGGKVHPEREDEIKQLIALIKEAVVQKKKIIIPSFALERAQEIIYLLSYYMQIGDIPEIPIYLDAPMASTITNIFADSWDEGMFAGQERLKFNPFNPDENKFLHIIPTQLDSLALVKAPGPYIVIAGSGMCDAGRVRDHLRAGLGNPNIIVCLVGYMAKNSLGRKLKDGLPIVNMNKKEIVVKARIKCFDSFSAHSDSPFLVSYAKALVDNHSAEDSLRKIFIVHGEENSSAFLKLELLEALADRKYPLKNIIIPKLNDEIIL
ncbi:MAG: MBL fold metallo-hydrolase [Candidatus Falkowbacteria bacterium]